MPPVAQANAEGPAPSRVLQRIDAFCERAILVIVALVVVWGPLAFGGLTAEGFLGIQGLTILALLFWLARLWVQRPFRLLCPPACWMAAVFLLYAVVRCQAQYVPVAIDARRELITVVVYAALFLVVLNNLHRRESTAVIAVCLIVLGGILSWHAVYQFATKSDHVWGIARREQFVGRGGATYVNPDHFSCLLGMSIPLALAYTVFSRFKPISKVFFVYCAAAMLGGIAVSLSRGGMLAAAATLVVLCMVLAFLRGHWLSALGVLVGMGAVAIVLCSQIESVQKRFEEMFNHGHFMDVREQYWPAAIHIFEDHPMWGGGPGQFDSEFAKYRPAYVQDRPQFAHNDYLNTLSDWGGFGFTIILIFLACFIYGIFRTWPNQAQADLETAGTIRSDKVAFLMGGSLAIFDLLCHSAVDFNMHIPANAAIAVIIMAFITGYWRFVTDRYWLAPGWPGKIVLTVLIAGGGGWLAAQGIQRGTETYWNNRAQNDSLPVDTRVAAMEKAYQADPTDYVTAYSLGEYFRLASQEGNPGYEALATKAMDWYDKSMKFNPLDAYIPMRYGMCLDWLGRTNEATPYFEKAEALDPESTHVAYFMGRHYMELGNYPKASEWFTHSFDIKYNKLAFDSWWLLQVRMKDTNLLYTTPGK